MATLDEELFLDAEEDARIVAYIRNALPVELKSIFQDEIIYYFIDLITEYYAESGILEQTPDSDGYVEIDLEAVAQHLAEQARKEHVGNFSPDDVLNIVRLHMDYEEAADQAE